MPTLPASLQPPPYRTPLFNTQGELVEEWRRFFLSVQTAILALLAFTGRIGSGQGMMGLEDAGSEDFGLVPGPKGDTGPAGTPGPWLGGGADGGDGGQDEWLMMPGPPGAVGPSGSLGPISMDDLEGEDTLLTGFAIPGFFSGFANPSANVGLTVVNGVATIAMRADAAPALDQAIVPTWTGATIWQKTVDSVTGQQFKNAAGVVILSVDAVNGRVGINKTAPSAVLDVQAVSAILRFSSTTGTNPAYVDLDNTGGHLYVGRESSAGQALVLGSSAYDGVLTVPTAHKLRLGTNNTTQQTIFSDGGVALQTGGGGTTPGISRLALPGGTAVATTDWALTSGWGANATISAVTGNDSRGTVTVTTSALDTPGANPVITLTFKDGTWTAAPLAVACMNGSGTGPLAAVAAQGAATTLALTYVGTPTAVLSRTYVFDYHVFG